MVNPAARWHTWRMKLRRTLALSLAALGIAVVGTLTACSPSGTSTPVQAPIVMDVGELQGASVDLNVDQVLDINTGDLAVDSYSGNVADPTVAEFIKGRIEGDASYNPGVRAAAPGTTTVTLSNVNGGIQDVTFTVTVAK